MDGLSHELVYKLEFRENKVMISLGLILPRLLTHALPVIKVQQMYTFDKNAT